jgi:hypothetical protein
MSNEDDAPAKTHGSIRIFVFKSETNPELRAFGGDLAGTMLPSQFRPWHAVGSIAPNSDFPYSLSRKSIETAINDCGYQMWRTPKKSKKSADSD